MALWDHFPPLVIPEGYNGFGVPPTIAPPPPPPPSPPQPQQQQPQQQRDEEEGGELKEDDIVLTALKNEHCVVCLDRFPIILSTCCKRMVLCNVCFVKVEKRKCVLCNEGQITRKMVYEIYGLFLIFIYF
eukprot:TCONS_00071519-protein